MRMEGRAFVFADYARKNDWLNQQVLCLQGTKMPSRLKTIAALNFCKSSSVSWQHLNRPWPENTELQRNTTRCWVLHNCEGIAGAYPLQNS